MCRKNFFYFILPIYFIILITLLLYIYQYYVLYYYTLYLLLYIHSCIIQYTTIPQYLYYVCIHTTIMLYYTIHTTIVCYTHTHCSTILYYTQYTMYVYVYILLYYTHSTMCITTSLCVVLCVYIDKHTLHHCIVCACLSLRACIRARASLCLCEVAGQSGLARSLYRGCLVHGYLACREYRLQTLYIFLR